MKEATEGRVTKEDNTIKGAANEWRKKGYFAGREAGYTWGKGLEVNKANREYVEGYREGYIHGLDWVLHEGYHTGAEMSYDGMVNDSGATHKEVANCDGLEELEEEGKVLKDIEPVIDL